MAESPITPRKQDSAAWYQDAVLESGKAEPARNCRLPLLIPRSLLHKGRRAPVAPGIAVQKEAEGLLGELVQGAAK
jgi:hypothetical protein